MAVANRFLGNADTATTATNSTKLNNQDASYYLNYNNLNNKPSLDFLPLSGGTLIGVLKEAAGSYVFRSNSGSGSAGYIILVRITVSSAYQNVPIYFRVQQRDAYNEYVLQFNNSRSVANCNISKFYSLHPNLNTIMYALKIQDGVYDLYLKKAESYDDICVTSYHTNFLYMSAVKLTWNGAYVADLPSGAIAATFDSPSSKWQTPRTITVNGNSSGSVTLDGSANVTLNLTNSYASGAGTAVQLTNTRTIFGQNFNGTANVVGRGVFYGVGADSPRYNNGAIEVREANLVSSGQSDMRYAPRIGFHWGGRYGNNLIMASDGEFRFTTSNDASYANVRANIFYGALSGNATTATTATNSNQLGGVAAANYLQKSGGTVTGAIARAGTSASWYSGRNYVVAKTNSSSGYSPAFSAKSGSGSWDIGTYTNDVLWFSYITDANYNAGNNVQTASFQFKTDGSIVAPGGFIGTSTNSNYATNSGQLGGIAAASYLNTSDTLILRGTV
jgi:hypothetical protein